MRSPQRGARSFLLLIVQWSHSSVGKTQRILEESHLFRLSQPIYGWCYLLWASCSSYSYRKNWVFFTLQKIWMGERLEVTLTTVMMSSQCVFASATYARFFSAYGKWQLWCNSHWISVRKRWRILLLPEHLSNWTSKLFVVWRLGLTERKLLRACFVCLFFLSSIGTFLRNRRGLL